MMNSMPQRVRPRSPNIQIYRPQLTSVLSFVNRISGIVLSFYAVGLVIWLMAAAAGPQAYASIDGFIRSWIAQILLVVCTYAFFLHLCGSLRHLVWDTVRGFELKTIYSSGWTIVAASAALTVVTWIVAMAVTGSPR